MSSKRLSAREIQQHHEDDYLESEAQYDADMEADLFFMSPEHDEVIDVEEDFDPDRDAWIFDDYDPYPMDYGWGDPYLD